MVAHQDYGCPHQLAEVMKLCSYIVTGKDTVWIHGPFSHNSRNMTAVADNRPR